MSGFAPPAWYRAMGRILTPVFRVARSPRTGPWHTIEPGATWIHAASLGELKGVLRLLESLPAAHRVYLTSSTESGLDLLRREVPQHPTGLLPLDSESVAREFLDALRPSCALFFESEAWPCHLAELSRRAIPIAFAAFRTTPTSMRRWKRFTSIFPGWTDSVTTAWTDGSSPSGALRKLGFRDVRQGHSLKWAGWPVAPPAPPSHRRAAMSLHLRDLTEIVRMMRRDPQAGWLLFPRRLWLRHLLRILVRRIGLGIAHQPSPEQGQVWIAPRFGMAREQLATCPWAWVSEGHDTEEPFVLGAKDVWTGSPPRKVERTEISTEQTRTEIVKWILDQGKTR